MCQSISDKRSYSTVPETNYLPVCTQIQIREGLNRSQLTFGAEIFYGKLLGLSNFAVNLIKDYREPCIQKHKTFLPTDSQYKDRHMKTRHSAGCI